MKRDLAAAIIISLVLHAGLLGLLHLATLPLGREAALAGAADSATAVAGAPPMRVVMTERRSRSGAAVAEAAGGGSETRRAPPRPLADPAAALEMARSADGPKPGNSDAAGDYDEAPADEEPAYDTAAAVPPGPNKTSGETSPPPETQTARPPRLLTPVDPEYPFRARRLGYEGTVAFTVLVGAEGSVLDITLDESSGHAELDEAARAAVGHASYIPGSSGSPMPLRVRVVFRLEAGNRGS